MLLFLHFISVNDLQQMHIDTCEKNSLLISHISLQKCMLQTTWITYLCVFVVFKTLGFKNSESPSLLSSIGKHWLLESTGSHFAIYLLLSSSEKKCPLYKLNNKKKSCKFYVITVNRIIIMHPKCAATKYQVYVWKQKKNDILALLKG